MEDLILVVSHQYESFVTVEELLLVGNDDVLIVKMLVQLL